MSPIDSMPPFIEAEPSKVLPHRFTGEANLVAVEALPIRVAVMFLAEKSPLASLATTLLAVFALVASTDHVTATEPSKVAPAPPVR